MTRWMNHKLGVKIFRKNINNLRYSDDTTLMAKSEEELNSFLMSVLEESEKADLKLNIQKTKIMASSPIISWQIDGKEAETMTDFIFLGSKITVDSDCSYEIKRHSLLKRCCDKSSQCNKKQRYHHAKKACIVKAMNFAVIYECESWTGKKAEPWRIDAFEL